MQSPLQSGQQTNVTDEQLVEQIRGGKPELFELLMRRHNARLYRAIRAVLKDEAQVEEVMQEAYLRAYAHLDQFDLRAAFATWLTRIGVHEAITRVRRAAIAPVPSDVAVLAAKDQRSTPDVQASNRELVQVLERAVDALPDGYREVFVLRRIDGFSVAETAEVLGLSEEAVKTRMFRANERLRDRLDRMLEESSEELFGFPATRCNRVVDAVLNQLKRSSP